MISTLVTRPLMPLPEIGERSAMPGSWAMRRTRGVERVRRSSSREGIPFIELAPEGPAEDEAGAGASAVSAEPELARAAPLLAEADIEDVVALSLLAAWAGASPALASVS